MQALLSPFGYQASLSSAKQAVTDQYYAWFHYFVYCIDRQHCFYKLLFYFIRGLTRVVLFIRLFRPIFLLYSEIIVQHCFLFSKIQFIHNTVYFCFVKPDIFLARSNFGNRPEQLSPIFGRNSTEVALQQCYHLMKRQRKMFTAEN